MDAELRKFLVDLKKGQEELFKGQSDLAKGQEKLFKGQAKLFKRVESLSKNQEKLSQAVARIEVEHGEKLEILLDVVTGHTDKFNSINERVENCEKRLDNHDDKFYLLKSAVQSY